MILINKETLTNKEPWGNKKGISEANSSKMLRVVRNLAIGKSRERVVL